MSGFEKKLPKLEIKVAVFRSQAVNQGIVAKAVESRFESFFPAERPFR
jgi:hypothetical protein